MRTRTMVTDPSVEQLDQFVLAVARDGASRAHCRVVETSEACVQRLFDVSHRISAFRERERQHFACFGLERVLRRDQILCREPVI